MTDTSKILARVATEYMGFIIIFSIYAIGLLVILSIVYNVALTMFMIPDWVYNLVFGSFYMLNSFMFGMSLKNIILKRNRVIRG